MFNQSYHSYFISLKTTFHELAFVPGAAAVSPDTVRFFLSVDMKVLEMITSTEAAGFMQLTNQLGPGNFRVGKVGRVYPDQQECKVLDKNSEGKKFSLLILNKYRVIIVTCLKSVG